MKNELIIKRCKLCGATVRVLKEHTHENKKPSCCKEQVVEILIPNTSDASKEKHIPTYELVEDEIFVSINHPMEKDHYIEWIALIYENEETFIKLYPEQNASCRFKYIPGSSIYAYCNKHELWKNDVK